MGSRLKEDEKNEKAIRSLLKKAPNRKCINCNSLGPQYVCLNFGTFVCTQCSGIHREFTHRVKSVSMSKFTSQEVTNLENGGNERGREIHFKDWDPQRQPLPDSSNEDRVRDFIKSVYVEKRFSGERPLPRGRGGDREDMYESRRPEVRSNNRLDSRSPPYEDKYEDHQPGARRSNVGYEDNRYEEQGGRSDERRTSRQFEADRGRPVRSYSDNRRSEDKGRYDNRGRHYEDRYNEGLDRRLEERFANERGYSSCNREYGGSSPPPVRPVKEILGEDVPPLRVEGPGSQTNGGHEVNRSSSLQDVRGQRFGSSSSFGSVDGNMPVVAPVVKRENSESLIDFLAEPAAPLAREQSDPFGLTSAAQPVTSASSSTGWATFDMFSSATAAGPGGAAPNAAPALSAPEGINNLAIQSKGSAQWPSQWPSMQPGSVPSSLEPRADSWLSLVESVSQPPTSAAGSEPWSSFSTSSTPIPTTLLSAGQLQIVQDLPNANSSTGSSAQGPPVVSTSRQELPENFFMGAQTGPHLTGAPLHVPQHTFMGGMSMPVGSYNQPQKSRNPFDLVGDSSVKSAASELPSMSPLQVSLPSLDISPMSMPGPGVGAFGPQWTQTNTMVLPPTSYPPAAPSGGLFAVQQMPNMIPQTMRAGVVGPPMGASMPGSSTNQDAEPYFLIPSNPQVPEQNSFGRGLDSSYTVQGGGPWLPLQNPMELAKGSGISQDSLFFSQGGQHFISQTSLKSLGSISGMNPLLPAQASPQFPTYNSLGPVSNPFG